MAKKRSPQNQLMPVKRDKLPEYGELVKLMQTETASVITDYIRQWIGVISNTPEPGQGIFINWDRVLRAQAYQELAWYDLYAEVEKDTHVAAVLANAKLNIAGMRWDISAFQDLNEEEPSARNTAIATFVKHVLSDIGYFPQHLYNLLDAIGKGFAVSEIIWEVGKDGIVVKDILNRPQRRFQFDAVDRSLRLRDIKQPYYGVPLPDRKFIVHRVASTWENPFGDALDQSIYWMWLFKKTIVKFWMQHLQVGASTIPIVKHPASANPKMKEEAMAIAENIRNGAYGRIPDNFEIQFAEAKNASQNAEAYNQFIRMADDQIAKCVNGQTLTSESSSQTGTGTLALGAVHQETQSARDEFRAHGLEATLNQTLVKWLVDFNFANVDGYPQFRFDMEAETDLAREAQIVQTLSNAGYDFDEGELSDKFNYTLTKKKPLNLGGNNPFGKPEDQNPEQQKPEEEKPEEQSEENVEKEQEKE